MKKDIFRFIKKAIVSTLLMFNACFILAQERPDSLSVKNDSILAISNKLRNVFTENKTDIPSIIPSSPQSQIFEKYIRHEVNEQNGLVKIEIPLYEIKLKELVIPITLSYHSSGIKFKQFDGEVGAGWALSTGGYRVSRTINGRPDEEAPFVDMNKFNELIKKPIQVWEMDAYLSSMGLKIDSDLFRDLMTYNSKNKLPHIQDGEHDFFSYTMPTTGGMFIVTDRYGSTATMKEHTDQIYCTINSFSGVNADIQINDMFGNKYIMGEGESAKIGDEYFTTAWPVSSITTPYYEKVEFEYIEETLTSTRSNQKQLIVNDAADPIVIHDTWIHPVCWTGSTVNHASYKIDSIQKAYSFDVMKFTNTIKTDNETVQFYRSVSTPFLIDKITIVDSEGNLVKNIEFTYKKIGNHHLLEAIRDKGDNTTEKVIEHKFEYYPNVVGAECPDQWGYYTTQQKGGDEHIFHEEFMEYPYIDRIHIGPGTGGMSYRSDRVKNISGIPVWVDRSYNVKADHYSLKRITYPTKGTVEYTYESNQYRLGENIVKGNGLRISKIVSKERPNSKSLETVFKYGLNEDGNAFDDAKRGLLIGLFHKEIPSFSGVYGAELTQGCSDGPMFPPYSWLIDRSNTQIFSLLPMGDSTPYSEIGYNTVTKYQYDENKKFNGKIISTFEFKSKYQINYDWVTTQPWTVSEYKLGNTPNVKSKEVYDKDDLLIQKEEYSYIDTDSTTYEGIIVKQGVNIPRIQLDPSVPSSQVPLQYVALNLWGLYSLFEFIPYKIRTGTQLLSGKITTLYTEKGDIKTNESYLYDENHQVAKKMVRSNNELVETSYKYPYDYMSDSDGIYEIMSGYNHIKPVIEEFTTRNGVEIFRNKTNYTGYPDGLLKLSSIEQSYRGAQNLKTLYSNDKFGGSGEVVQQTHNGVSSVYLWSSDCQYVMAEIKNATLQEVSVHRKVILKPNDTHSTLELNALRTKLPNALITTYTYKPLVGILTATDARGITTYYEYDTFGRLKETYIIEDGLKKVVQYYDYNYRK